MGRKKKEVIRIENLEEWLSKNQKSHLSKLISKGEWSIETYENSEIGWCFVFFHKTEISQDCCFGIDIGKNNTFISGLKRDEDEISPMELEFIAHFDFGNLTSIEAAYIFGEFIEKAPLNILKTCKSVGIEQQVNKNGVAMAISHGFASTIRVYRRLEGVSDPFFIHGEHKYKPAPYFNEDCEKSKYRSLDRTGKKGKSIRKKLCVEDIFNIFRNKEKETFKILDFFKGGVNKLDDLCDSILLASWQIYPEIERRSELMQKKRASEKAKEKRKKAKQEKIEEELKKANKLDKYFKKNNKEDSESEDEDFQTVAQKKRKLSSLEDDNFYDLTNE